MKQYKRYYEVKDSSKILGYQFIIKISLIPQTYRFEMEKMRRLLKEECKKQGWNHLDLMNYADLIEDRRSNKFIPKGYRSYRFMYTHRNNVIYIPSYPK